MIFLRGMYVRVLLWFPGFVNSVSSSSNSFMNSWKPQPVNGSTSDRLLHHPLQNSSNWFSESGKYIPFLSRGLSPGLFLHQARNTSRLKHLEPQSPPATCHSVPHWHLYYHSPPAPLLAPTFRLTCALGGDGGVHLPVSWGPSLSSGGWPIVMAATVCSALMPQYLPIFSPDETFSFDLRWCRPLCCESRRAADRCLLLKWPWNPETQEVACGAGGNPITPSKWASHTSVSMCPGLHTFGAELWAGPLLPWWFPFFRHTEYKYRNVGYLMFLFFVWCWTELNSIVCDNQDVLQNHANVVPFKN